MVDIEKEDLVPLKQISQLSGCSYNTVLRWVRNGSRSVGGRIVKLETTRTPSGNKTSVEAYYRFIRSLNEC